MGGHAQAGVQARDVVDVATQGRGHVEEGITDQDENRDEENLASKEELPQGDLNSILQV